MPRHTAKDVRHQGEYKTLSNQVEAFDETGKSIGVIFETSAPLDTPRDMHDLVAWLKQTREEKAIHALLAIAVFVVVFLAIHPFRDGNGRLSRILTTLLLLQGGYSYVPYASLESVVEQNKESYYLALRRTQGTLKRDDPDWQPWITFFLRALQRQKRALEAKIDREQIMRVAMPALATTILDLVAAHGQVGVGDILRATGAPRATIKKRIGELVKSGHLKRIGDGRSSRYVRS